MTASHLETKNLKLVLHAPEHLRALIQGSDSYARSIGAQPANGLRDFFVSKDVSPDWLARLETATEADPWTHGFALVHVASGTVIGGAGFKGPPGSDGAVEIAYGVVPEYQGKGYATEAAQALIAYAFGCGQVRAVRAHTLPEPNASTRVLAKCGFRHIVEVIDPEDGLVWRWEKNNEVKPGG
jgi:[ribosomal protein S5]-alanine N-acetyltransferase